MPNRQTVIKFVKHCLPLVVIVVLLPAVAAACGPAPMVTLAPTAPETSSHIPLTMAPQHGWELPADKYVFIDHHVHIEGVCIEGECQPGPMIDFPTYTFSAETGTLNSWLTVEVNDALKVVYGNGMSLGGVAGGGAGTQLTEVYTLPAEIEGLRIVQIDRDGTALLEYKGELLALAPC